MAANLPGALMRDLGADVVRVQLVAPVDARRRHRIRTRVESRQGARGRRRRSRGVRQSRRSARDADVLFVTGSEAVVERQGLGYRRPLARRTRRLVAVRIRPSVNAQGALPDLELLVAARAGLPTQIRSHDGGPAFPDLHVAGAGAALTATAGALACLYEREATGVGGWAETSLYDGLHAMLPMIIGRVEHPSATTNLLWRDQGPAEALSYRCADGEYVQLWFGAKGAYEAFLAHVGDPPSEQGYNADLDEWCHGRARRAMGGDVRHPRPRPGGSRTWRVTTSVASRCGVPARRCATRTSARSAWPSSTTASPCSGPPCGVTSVGDGAPLAPVDGARLGCCRACACSTCRRTSRGRSRRMVLAELGADVVKVEPLTGDVHRSMEPMFAAGPARASARWRST